MRRFLGLLLLLLPAPGLWAAEDWTRVFPVKAVPEVQIKVNDGNIKVTAGSASEVRVSVGAPGLESGKDYEVRPSQTENRIEVQIERTRKGSGRTLEVEVQVPAKTNLDLNTEDGNITAQGVTGTIRARSGDGNIEAATLEGSLDLTTEDGNIDASPIRGSLAARTKDGNVIASGHFEHLEVESGDGNIEVSVEEGSAMLGNWSVSTRDGAISLTLPANFNAELDASASDGRVRSDLPGVTATASQERSSLRAKLNSGGKLLTVHSDDGDVRIYRR